MLETRGLKPRFQRPKPRGKPMPRHRDTAWFAMTDRDWPGIAAAQAAWLDPRNFDAAGRQRQRLGDLTAPVVARAEAEHRGG